MTHSLPALQDYVVLQRILFMEERNAYHAALAESQSAEPKRWAPLLSLLFDLCDLCDLWCLTPTPCGPPP